MSLKSLKLKISKIYQNEAKYIFSSTYIAGIILTILSFEYGIGISLLYFLVYTFIAFFGIKLAGIVSWLFCKDKNTLGMFIFLYVLFFSYLLVNYSDFISSFIVENLKIQPEIFEDVVNYISVMKSFEYTIGMFSIPILLSFMVIVFSAMFSKLDSWKPVSVIIFKLFIVISTLTIIMSYFNSNSGSTMWRPYEYWISKHGFVDSVLCESETYEENVVYPNFKAKKITDSEYLILDKRTRKYHFYKEFKGKKKPYNYYKITCKQIESYQSKLGLIINKTYKVKEILSDRIKAVIKK